MELLGAQVIRLPHAKGQGGRWVGHLVAGVVLLVTTALLASWVHVQNITYRYQYTQAYRVQQKRAQIRDALEIERQMLRRPQRIIHMAEDELGMRMPSVGERVIVE
jgi:cell division protein FtsL